MNTRKCRGPARRLSILGHMYDSILRRVYLPLAKRNKFLADLRSLLSNRIVLSKDIERTLGYLCFASLAEPFGRPFLSAIAACINHFEPFARVELNNYAIIALKI